MKDLSHLQLKQVFDKTTGEVVVINNVLTDTVGYTDVAQYFSQRFNIDWHEHMVMKFKNSKGVKYRCSINSREVRKRAKQTIKDYRRSPQPIYRSKWLFPKDKISSFMDKEYDRYRRKAKPFSQWLKDRQALNP